MNPVPGYYSLIQYCPDRYRAEAVNVGVLLFVPTRNHYLKALTSRNNQRIRHVFGSKGLDWQRVNAAKQAVVYRVQSERDTIRAIEDLRQFTAAQANVIRLTEPRPLTLPSDDLDAELSRLYRELVGKAQHKTPPLDIREAFRQSLANAGLQERVRQNVVVRTIANRPLRADGYQNGRFQLIRAARFDAEDVNRTYRSAMSYAYEGKLLFEHDDPTLGKMRQVLIGSFAGSNPSNRTMVQAMMDESKVHLVYFEEMDKLIEEIRRTAKPLPDFSTPAKV